MTWADEPQEGQGLDLLPWEGPGLLPGDTVSLTVSRSGCSLGLGLLIALLPPRTPVGLRGVGGVSVDWGEVTALVLWSVRPGGLLVTRICSKPGGLSTSTHEEPLTFPGDISRGLTVLPLKDLMRLAGPIP